ncbi:DoxX family protein [Aeoliella sp. SH292]|jgi:putative oxidoreductase|uniref:DoxX family protein n=1 Tax=Aeoliella sp. SH292 TaxID=3454464 RepID=UPI003F987636
MDDIGKLILRITVGGLMLPHGMAKMSAAALGGLQSMLASQGIPGFVAYGVYVGEVLAPILIIIGFLTRPAAAVFAFNMVVAIYLAHASQLVQLSDKGGLALELQYLYLFGAIAIAFLGAGKYSISGGTSKWD